MGGLLKNLALGVVAGAAIQAAYELTSYAIWRAKQDKKETK